MTNVEMIKENELLIHKFIHNHNLLIKMCDNDYEDAYQECCLCLSKAFKYYNENKGKPTTFVAKCLNRMYKRKLYSYNVEKKGNQFIFVSFEDSYLSYTINDDLILAKKILKNCSEELRMYCSGKTLKEIGDLKGISKQGVYKKLKKELEQIRAKYL